VARKTRFREFEVPPPTPPTKEPDSDEADRKRNDDSALCSRLRRGGVGGGYNSHEWHGRFDEWRLTHAVLNKTQFLNSTFEEAGAPVPEPASIGLIGAGLLGLRRRRRRVAARREGCENA
jgi:hypothetical protein